MNGFSSSHKEVRKNGGNIKIPPARICRSKDNIGGGIFPFPPWGTEKGEYGGSEKE